MNKKSKLIVSDEDWMIYSSTIFAAIVILLISIAGLITVYRDEGILAAVGFSVLLCFLPVSYLVKKIINLCVTILEKKD